MHRLRGVRRGAAWHGGWVVCRVAALPLTAEFDIVIEQMLQNCLRSQVEVGSSPLLRSRYATAVQRPSRRASGDQRTTGAQLSMRYVRLPASRRRTSGAIRWRGVWRGGGHRFTCSAITRTAYRHHERTCLPCTRSRVIAGAHWITQVFRSMIRQDFVQEVRARTLRHVAPPWSIIIVAARATHCNSKQAALTPCRWLPCGAMRAGSPCSTPRGPRPTLCPPAH